MRTRLLPGGVLGLLVACAAQGATAYVPATAIADGWEQGPRCSYGVPGSLSPPIVIRNITLPGAPVTPPSEEFVDSEKEPASNFSVTANWGDGTASPAAVERDGGEGCYKISPPLHAYGKPGIYSFSYTVHDSRTGHEHTLGNKTYEVLSFLPIPVSEPTPRLIKATVGVPWTGNVGEFDLSIFTEAVPYTATIEWGDGQVSPATILATNKQLIISGWHTYSHPLSTTLKVSIDGGTESGSWTTANVLVAEAPPQFDGQPILAAIPRADGRNSYAIVFRLKRSLPRIDSGRVGASLTADGLTSPLAVFDAHRSRSCYIAKAAAFARRSVRAGRHYPFALILQQPSTKVVGHALLRSYTSSSSMLSRASRQLGC